MSELESQLEECGVCHALHPYNELACFDDTLICAECLEDSTVICGRCGERMWRDDDQGNEDSGHLCQSCYDRICAVATCLNDDELKQMSWSTFVAGCGHYPELVQYLKERRIYINEPVTAEAEV